MHGGAFVYIGRERQDVPVLSVARSAPMTTTLFRALALLLSALLGSFSAEVGETFTSHDFDRKLTGLHKVLSYVYDRPEQMNVDAAFGITIAEANIAAALLHENARYLNEKHLKVLRQILKLCEDTRQRLKNTVIPESQNICLVNDVLNNPQLWIRRISWSRGALGSKPNPSPGLNQEVAQDLLFRGTPQERESDICLSRIIKSKLHGHCRIPDKCVELLKKDDNTRGYPLAHRLLLIQVARVLGCSDDYRISFSFMIPAYCRSILQDLIDLEVSKFPNVSRDLMSEQVLLCGSEGFVEFIDKRYSDLILGWSHTSGCYSAIGFPRSRKVKRMTFVTDYGCDSHATGLAAAGLALFIRHDVETALGNI